MIMKIFNVNSIIVGLDGSDEELFNDNLIYIDTY